MIPSIETIIEDLIAGQCTAAQAMAWIAQHMENADLRDHFAGLAMQGDKANPNGFETPENIAVYAYEIADAMLKARQS
jgi:hypothetical protein